MLKKEFTKEDVVKLLGIKVKSVGGELNKFNGDISKKEMNWYLISRVDRIYELLSDHITYAERTYIHKEHVYKLIACVVSILSLMIMYATL